MGVGGYFSIAFDIHLFTNNQAMLKTPYFVQHSTLFEDSTVIASWTRMKTNSAIKNGLKPPKIDVNAFDTTFCSYTLNNIY